MRRVITQVCYSVEADRLFARDVLTGVDGIRYRQIDTIKPGTIELRWPGTNKRPRRIQR